MAVQVLFIRKTTLAPEEYRANFTITDNEIIDTITSAEALGITTLMPAIYLRLQRAPLDLLEREGVLRFIGTDESGEAITAWEQLRRLTGVSNSTLSKALKWLHSRGVIGYDAHKNGIGIRIFLNRAASSIRRREGQKNLRLVGTPQSIAPAPQNGTAFKEHDSKIDLDNCINPRACARDDSQACNETLSPMSAREAQTNEVPHLRAFPHPTARAGREVATVLAQQIITELRTEIATATKRQADNTREWFLNYGLPKATRVAQRETYDLLRSYGVIAKKPQSSGRVGQGCEPPQQGREGETTAAFLAETIERLRQVAAASVVSEETPLRGVCQSAATELSKLHDLIIAGQMLAPEEIETKLRATDEALIRALWEAADPSDRKAMLQSARAELRKYESRMEASVFDDTVWRRAAARLREERRLPHLSLFYV